MRCLLAMLLFTALGAGCRMCDSPYDYCGPVVDDGYRVDYPGAYSSGGATAAPETVESGEPVYYEGARGKPAKAAPKTAMQTPSRPKYVPARQMATPKTKSAGAMR